MKTNLPALDALHVALIEGGISAEDLTRAQNYVLHRLSGIYLCMRGRAPYRYPVTKRARKAKDEYLLKPTHFITALAVFAARVAP